LIFDAASIAKQLGPMLGRCSEIRLATLFGSCARGTMGASSDVDVLIWLQSASLWNRVSVWNWIDTQVWPAELQSRLSPVIKRWRHQMSIDTLLLDFPEEHVYLAGDRRAFDALRQAVVHWRRKNGAAKIQAFNGTHGWRYTDDPTKDLASIDFTIEVPDP
jgi:UTP:GlnB (protein PII) uridylyltransferase